MTPEEASYILRDTEVKVTDETVDKQKYFDALWLACVTLNPNIKSLYRDSEGDTEC